MVRQPIEEIIREKVRGLLAARGHITQEEFGTAVGRQRSWVSAFLKGRRHANEIHLVARIARYFGVSVGYLLGERERQYEPAVMTMVEAFSRLSERDRSLVLSWVLTLPQTRESADAPATDEPDGADHPATRRKWR